MLLTWDSVIVSTGSDVLVLIIAYFMFRGFIKHVPHNETVDTKQKEITLQVARLTTEVNTSLLELYDYVDAVLQPLNKRLATRMSREKVAKETEEEDEPKKKGGILAPSKMHK